MRCISRSARRFSTAVLVVMAAAAAAGQAQVIDRLMAIVSGEPITLTDVTAATTFKLITVPSNTPDPLGYVLDRLIQRQLVLAEVDRFQPPEPDPVEITVRTDALEQQASSAAAFQRMLDETGMSRDRLRLYIRNDLRITTYLNQRFGATLSGAAPADRRAAIQEWVGELRHRGDVTVLYLGK